MLGRKSLLVFLGSLLASILGFACLFFINRYIGVEKYGAVILITSILSVINVITDLGFNNAHIKKISEGCDIEDCVSTFTLIKVNLTCIYVLASFLCIIIYVELLGGVLTEGAKNVFLIILAFEVLVNLANIAYFTYQGTSEAAKVQTIQVAAPITRLPLTVLIAFTFSDEVLLALTYLAGAMVMMIAAIYLLRKNRFRWRTPTLFRPYLAFALPLVLLTLINIVYAFLDKIVLGFALGNVTVGNYSTVQTLLAVIAAIGSAVAILTFPNFSALFVQGNVHEIKEKSKMGERFISILAMPLVVVMVLFPGELLSALFGPTLYLGGEAMRYLVIATFLIMLSQVYYSQLLASNRPKVLMNATLVGFALGVPLLLILIPDELMGIRMVGLGLQGAGVAMLVSTVVPMVMVRMATRDINGHLFNPKLGLHLISAIVTGAVLWGLSFVLDARFVIELSIIILVAYGVFLSVMIALKEFRRNDIDYLMDMLDLKKMFHYISSEMKEKKE